MSVKAWEEKNIGEWEHEYALLLEYADGLTGLLPDGDGQIIWDDYSYMSLTAEMYRAQHPGTRAHLVKRRCEIVSVAPDKRPGDAHGA